MGNRILVSLRIGILCITTCLCLYVRAQSVPSPKIQTPNVASLEKFGEIPVDLSTGVPNINIPIHTLQYGNISVPIALRYHPGGVRVSQHPGWVGTGWDLESIGSITRRICMLPDEYSAPNTPADIVAQSYGSFTSTYFPLPQSSPPTSGGELLDNTTDWNTTTRLRNLFGASGGALNDICADEFSFNFLGYSGKFYYVSPSKGWQVVADQNIKVELTNNVNPRLPGNKVNSTISNYFSSANANHLHVGEAYSSTSDATDVFSGFTLTVADGTKYYFGGVDANGNGLGIEFSSQYGVPITQFTANSWLLTKIVDINNNEVDFQYSASYPTCDLGFGYNGDTWNCQVTTGGFLGHVFGDGSFSSGIDKTVHGGTLSLPLYLDKITCSNETITFNRDVANSCLRLPNNMLTFIHQFGSNTADNKFNLGILYDGVAINGQIINGPDNLQWEQLNNIVVTNNNNQEYRQFQFNYSSDPNQRLTLNSFAELDNASPANSVKKYAFSYNTALPSSVLYDANYSDHWGFYNAIDIGTPLTNSLDAMDNSIFSKKITDQFAVTNGLLNKITYPTGGYSAFTWEPHYYSQVVSAARNGLINNTGYAGGCRISEVKSFLPDGSTALDKQFLYVRGYSKANPNGLSSSGVLNGTPSYFINLQNRAGLINQTIESISVASLNSLASYSYNSQGSYISYDEVVELDADNSYTKSFFTGYTADQNGITHYDIAPVASIGWASGDVYFPLSTLDAERGKVTGVYKYTANDVLVQKTNYTYRNDPGRFNSYIKSINFNGAYAGCAQFDALILATANQIFTYPYYVTNLSATNYDQRGKNPITTSTSFVYNINNLQSVKTEINSKGESIVTTYKYPFDYSDATSLAMTAAHILSPVIETSVSKNGTFLSLTHTNYFSPYTNIYVPQNIQMQIGSNAIETRQQFYQYDMHGNIEDLSKPNDAHEVYLWGYNSQYPVAKIVGSTYGAVIAIVSQAQVDAATSTISNDAGVRSLLQLLRTGLPHALVTSYTYLPVTGITSETDPRGQTTYYEYDSFQRLKLIKDYSGNILKTFNYQYQVPQ